MSVTSKISWCDSTWSPLVGCSRVSSGCANCYAVKEVRRLSGNPHPKIAADFAGLVERHGNGQLDWTGQVRVFQDRLRQPLHWKRPRRIFVNSMSDVFHENVPFHVIDDIFDIMKRAHWHTFQVLTKRPARMAQWADSTNARHDDILGGYEGPGIPNIWLGVSVETQATADERIPWLLKIPTAVRFISAEPLLAPIDLRAYLPMGPWHDPRGDHWCVECSRWKGALDWVICGGESGPKARPCDLDWLRSVVQQCQVSGVPCWVKQVGRWPYEVSELDRAYPLKTKHKAGADPAEWPSDLQVQQMPEGRV